MTSFFGENLALVEISLTAAAYTAFIETTKVSALGLKMSWRIEQGLACFVFTQDERAIGKVRILSITPSDFLGAQHLCEVLFEGTAQKVEVPGSWEQAIARVRESEWGVLSS